ncbi:activated cdc42 kinase 1 [Echinococcus multilocularis]|uniref:non-specific protein-tyrosine kinase n=1 Tax=Echinococcus multilocularis TaxID=6211 RepID=A0A068Y4W6_ECHMU|nr:activated cdc42 kinase 1 [Echinococcus multilocularis]
MSSSDWLRTFLDEVQLPDFYDAFKNVLQVTQLQHFDFVRTADLHRIGLSTPAIGRIKEVIKIHRENAGLLRKPRKKHHHRLSFGVPLLHLLRYGPPRDAPILSTLDESTSLRRCYSDVTHAVATSPSPFSSGMDPLPPCQLIRLEDVNLHKENNGHLGSGSFGVVRRGDWKTPSGETLPVALKILRCSKADDAADFFSTVLSEVMLMQSVSHPNLVRIYGIIPLNPLVIVTELAPLGSLLTALRAHSRRLNLYSGSCVAEGRPATAFSVDVLWDMGIQLARGMAHLAACHLIHRDLAARNVLLFSAPTGVTVKIGDFGLLRRGSVMDEDGSGGSSGEPRVPGCVYVGVGKQKIPFAWSPPEAIQGRRFSQASDVWSWGVTVWEVWSGGAEPWSGLSSDVVLAELRTGRRLAWPRTTCPRRLYQLLLATWRYNLAHRPSFEYLVDRLDKIRPTEVIAKQNFDEADRMDVVTGDRILVIEGRAENFWWRGQNRRTGEIASFPREIVRLQRHLQGQDISRPIENSFVHVGHHGFEGKAWGHVDRIDPAFLSGIIPHHADTLGHTYARQPLSASSISASNSQSWRPLGNASIGGGGGSGASVAASTAIEEVEDGTTPRVDTYDKASGEGEDERELLDASPHGTLGLQRLPPPPTASMTSKLAKDLKASLHSKYCSLGCSSLTASSLPVPIPSPQISTSSRSRNCATTTATNGGGGGRSARASSPSSTLSSASLIDFHQSSESASKFPIPSAPIYQSQALPPRNPYFQAAWNAWMRQSAASSVPTTAPHGAEDVDHIRRLFDATPIVPPSYQQCEREVLVGAASTNLNPFLSPQSHLPESVCSNSWGC